MVGAAWIGKPFAPMVHPDDLPLAREMQRLVLRGEPAPVFELRGHPSLSRPAIMEITPAPQMDEGGKITAVLGVGRDITERKRSEAELGNLHKLNSVNVSAGVVAASVKRIKAGSPGNTTPRLETRVPFTVEGAKREDRHVRLVIDRGAHQYRAIV